MRPQKPGRAAVASVVIIPFALGCFIVVQADGRLIAIVLGAAAIIFAATSLLLVSRPFRESRRLPPAIAAQVAKLPEAQPNSHVVDFQLRNGTVVRKQYVAWGDLLVMPPWRKRPGFDLDDIVEVSLHSPDQQTGES
jgi:hypothetical protein